MSLFSDLEQSIFGGKPIDLFRFVHGSQVWTYSRVGKDVVYNEETYTKLAIRRSSIGHQSEIAKSDITVEVPISSGVSQLFLAGYVENVVSLTIFHQQDGATDTRVGWKGRITLASWDDGVCKLTGESIYGRQRRNGLRDRYTRGCQYCVYERGCNLDKNDFAISGTVSAIDSSLTTLTVPEAAAYTDGYFLAGMVETVDGAYRFITGHSGATLVLTSPVGSVAVDDTLTLYGGCDHSRATCNDKFSNILNYGGKPWIPVDNPNTGSVV